MKLKSIKIVAFNKLQFLRRMKSVNEYDPKYWKHGVNVTVGQFCDHVKKNIPSDAMLYICGDNNVRC